MKFSALARSYDQIQQAKTEPKRREILAALLRKADRKTLEALAHFTAGEVVKPELSDALGIGPGTIRNALSAISGKETGEIDSEVKRTGDMSEVVAALVKGSDKLAVDELWARRDKGKDKWLAVLPFPPLPLPLLFLLISASPRLCV